jgi:hypothetical protein
VKSQIVSQLQSYGWPQVVRPGGVPRSVCGVDLVDEHWRLLGWTNGGALQLGPSPLSLLELFSVEELEVEFRSLERWMSNVIPLGSDGGDRLYVYDVRATSRGQVLSLSRGDLGWGGDSIRVLGASLAEAVEVLASIGSDVDDPGEVGLPLERSSMREG